jgi:predicted xylose isomerase-like sugar epimerase
MKGAAYMNKGIKFSGHTMGTPDLDIYGAIKLFKSLGFDGVEVRVANNGQIDSESITDGEVRNIRLSADHEGMEFSCLTSYYQDFMPAKRERVIANLCRVALRSPVCLIAR